MNGSSRRVILVCEECGERMVLGGPLSVWYSESPHFGCECGREFTLADRLDQQRVSRAGASRARRGRPRDYTVEVRTLRNSRESPTAHRRKGNHQN
jgi:hypothetical protein